MKRLIEQTACDHGYYVWHLLPTKMCPGGPSRDVTVDDMVEVLATAIKPHIDVDLAIDDGWDSAQMHNARIAAKAGLAALGLGL